MKESVKLTQFAKSAGCAAKIGPKVLAEIVGGLPKFFDPPGKRKMRESRRGSVSCFTGRLCPLTLQEVPPSVRARRSRHKWERVNSRWHAGCALSLCVFPSAALPLNGKRRWGKWKASWAAFRLWEKAWGKAFRANLNEFPARRFPISEA